MMEKRPGCAADSRRTNREEFSDTPKDSQISMSEILRRFNNEVVTEMGSQSGNEGDGIGVQGHGWPRMSPILDVQGAILRLLAMLQVWANRQKLRITCIPPPSVHTDSG